MFGLHWYQWLEVWGVIVLGFLIEMGILGAAIAIGWLIERLKRDILS